MEQLAGDELTPRPWNNLTPEQIDKLAATRDALAGYETPASAFFPLLPRTREVSPLLPFYIGMLGAREGSGAKAIAVTRFRHVPYDAVVVVAEKIGNRWTLISIGAMVDH